MMSGHFLRSCGEAQQLLPVDLKRLITTAMYYGMGLNMVEQRCQSSMKVVDFFFLCGMCVWLVGDIINTSVPCCLRHPVYISTVGIVADFVSNTSFGSQEYGLMFFFGQPQ